MTPADFTAALPRLTAATGIVFDLRARQRSRRRIGTRDQGAGKQDHRRAGIRRGRRPDRACGDVEFAHPRVVDQSYIADWNGKQAKGYGAADGNWGYGPVYRSIYENLLYISLVQPDEYAAWNTGHIVYHDDWGDYSTNEPIMDGTANLAYLLSAMSARR